MKKIKSIFSLGLKFSEKYLKEYIKLIAKPLFIGIIGICAMLFIQLDPIFALLGIFITIPCIFYSFWKGFFITYALNATAYYFLKNKGNYSIETCLNLLKTKEKKFAGYISICAIVSIFAYIPTFYIFCKNFKDINLLLYSPESILSISSVVFVVFLINTIVLLPFLNFMTQAYYFKKEDENVISIILNCYKYLDLTGILIIIFIYVLNIILSISNILICVPLMILLNLFIYSINTFWYYTKTFKNLSH